jgi:hypothetical protein
MDHHRLVRRPLALLEIASLAEPFKADRITNALRRMKDRLEDPRKRGGKSAYNRRQRDLYHRRVPTSARKLRPGEEESSYKRKAPEKRLGKRMRTR